MSEKVDDTVDYILRGFVSDPSNIKVIYFDGWKGFGAYSVLRDMADMLKHRRTNIILPIDKVIHIDCSTWKSIRAMQRAIAVQLELGHSVMAAFDNRDDDDDFNGVDEDSRGEIASVRDNIFQALKDHRFMLIFHNGSDKEIEVTKFGIPLLGTNNLMVWTFRKRFQAREENKVTNADIFIYGPSYNTAEGFFFSVLEIEAAAIATSNLCMQEIDKETIMRCFLYGLFLHLSFPEITGYDWEARASNYWTCDCIIHGGQAWEISYALREEIKWDLCPDFLEELCERFVKRNSSKDGSTHFLILQDEQQQYPWKFVTSSSSNQQAHDMLAINTETSSYFLLHESPGTSPLVLEDCLFNHSNNLRVLHLSCCAFKFESPPFTCCQNMRFLGLDRCQDHKPSEDVPDRKEWAFLHSLWVLDIFYTDWFQILSDEATNLMINLWELNVEGAKCSYTNVSLARLPKMKKLRLIKLSSIDQMHGKATELTKISLEGCKQMEILFLHGLHNLVELDFSGSAIKVLDFDTMVVETPSLKRLFLLGCEHLRAIKWGIKSSKIQTSQMLVCIDTRGGIGRPRPSIDLHKPNKMQLHAILTDARLARSLGKLIQYYKINQSLQDVYFNICITSSAMHSGVIQPAEATCKQTRTASDDLVNMKLLGPTVQYKDVTTMVGEAQIHAFPQFPESTDLGRRIEIAKGSHNVEDELLALDSGNLSLNYLITIAAEYLHVHDAPIISTFPKYDDWSPILRRCLVERCPKLKTVFPSYSYGLQGLETFCASDLLMAHSIWSTPTDCYFKNLQHLHLRRCPSLQFVLPVYYYSFPSLETLHIVHCGELKHLFTRHPKLEYDHYERRSHEAFPKLATIHLHDLPALQQICEFKMAAPVLRSIWTKGCFSLRRLPAVGARGGGESKPAVEMEKDVWDALEWDDEVQPSHFQAPTHSRYYRKRLPRGSLLR